MAVKRKKTKAKKRGGSATCQKVKKHKSREPKHRKSLPGHVIPKKD